MSVGTGLTLDDIRMVEIEFLADRMSAGEALWVQQDWCAQTVRGKSKYQAFAEQFSVAIRAGDCFEHVNFVDHHTVVLRAERYGGNGVFRNGGGSRCGNMAGYQLKGIGPNPLVGDHNRTWHSYGGLNARDAVYEALMAQILGRVLPIGTAKVYGVILTSSASAYYEGDEPGAPWTRGWGAILVREVCLRPGHFFRVPDYKPKRGGPARLAPDSIRVKSINRALRDALPNTGEFIQRLGGFLRNCANQFAVAKLARLTHGSICPSNLCFDGRWIDLTNTSFIGGGQNVGGCPPIYEEPYTVREIIAEFLDTFSKYNDLDLNPGPLIGYYDEQLDAYYMRSLPLLFGIEPEAVAHAMRTAEGRDFLFQVSLVLKSGGAVVNRWPTSMSENDPVLLLQQGLFASCFDSEVGLKMLAPLKHVAPGFVPTIATTQFTRLVHAAHEAALDDGLDLRNFVRLCAIEALKRTLFAEFFFKGRLAKHINALLSVDPFSCRKLMDDSIVLSEWIFAFPNACRSYLYRSDNFSLIFDARKGCYCTLIHRTGAQSVVDGADRALKVVDQRPARDFVAHAYDFRVPLKRLLRSLEPLQEGRNPVRSRETLA